MNKYYYIPKKPFVSRLVYLWDIILLALALVLAAKLIPLDASAGIGGTSRARAEGIEKLLCDATVDEGFFDTLFKTDSFSSDVYKGEDFGTYMLYKDGKYITYDRDAKAKKLFGDETHPSAPAGLITPSGLLAIGETSVYFDNFEGYYGEADIDAGRYFYTGGNFDFEKVTETLVRGKSERLTLTETAAIYALIDNGTLVGFSNETAWYVASVGDAGYHLIRHTLGEELALSCEIEEYSAGVRVIENKYLVYGYRDFLYVYSFEDKSDKKLDLEDTLLGFGYAVDEDGGVTVYTYTEDNMIHFDMTGVGVEYENVVLNELDEEPDSMTVTNYWDKVICWLGHDGEYTSYEK